MPLLWVGEHAAFRLAKHLIPVTRDEVIEAVTNRPRDESDYSRDIPNATQDSGKEEKGISFGKQSFGWLFIIEHRIDSVERFVIYAMPFQQSGGKFALQRSELKTIMTISLQQKLDGAIAKAADAVIKHDCFRFGFTHGDTSGLATCTDPVLAGPCVFAHQ
jgi:hypothetical protein